MFAAMAQDKYPNWLTLEPSLVENVYFSNVQNKTNRLVVENENYIKIQNECFLLYNNWFSIIQLLLYLYINNTWLYLFIN